MIEQDPPIGDDETAALPPGRHAQKRSGWFTRKRILIASSVAGAVLLVAGGGFAFAGTVASPTRFGPQAGIDTQGNIHQCIVNGFVKPNTTLVDAKGPKGAICYTIAKGKDAQALPYGVGSVYVARGTSAATPWGEFSTTLGSPANSGDTASGTFRMTCSDAQAPCKISAKAFATVSGVFAYPRLDIMRQDLNGGPETYCEYADGTDNNGGSIEAGHTPTALTLGVGGSLDCGSTQTLPANGVVDDIEVPAGHYDISATFQFKKSGA